MKLDEQTAWTIANNMLEKTGTALMKDDFATFKSCFLLPHRVENFDGFRILKTEDDLRSVFVDVRFHLAEMGVTDLVRRCIAAKFETPDRIATTHETRLMNKAQMVQAPYPVFGYLQNVDGEWKIADGLYAIADSPGHSKIFNSDTDTE